MASLLRHLMTRSAPDLAALAAAWAVRLPGRGHAEDVATLYRVMTDTWALRDILEDLPLAAGRALWRGARADGWPTPPAVDDDTLAPLVARGLVQVEADTVHLADETGALLRRLAAERRPRDRARQPLAALIGSLDAAELAAAAERWGLDYRPGDGPRAPAERALHAAVTAPLAVDDMLARLEHADRALHGVLLAGGGSLPLAEVRRRSRLPPPVLRRALRHLHTCLLVWEAWIGRERHLFVPIDLRRPGWRTAAPPRPVAGAGDVWRHPLGLSWDLLAWLHWHARPGRAREPLPEIYPLWGAPTADARAAYTAFLRAAVAALDLHEPGAVAAWAGRPLPGHQAALVAAWQAARHPWDAAPRPDRPVMGGDWAAARAALLEVARRLEPGAWYPIETVIGQTLQRRRAPRAEEARRTRPRRDRGTPDPARLLLRLVRHDLAWLGLVEAGRALAGGGAVVRLTPVGAWLLQEAAAPDWPAPALEVEPSSRLLVYEVDAPLLRALLAAATPEHLDRVSLFRLSRASVSAGLAAGLTPTGLLAELERAARHPIPQNVAYALHDWARAARPSRLTRALLLSFDNDQARDEALHLAPLRALGAEALPRGRLALPIDDEAAERRARATLHALGLGPPVAS